MRGPDIIAAAPDLPPDIRQAILDLDAKAYQQNARLEFGETQVYMRLQKAIADAGGQAAFGRLIGIPRRHVFDVLIGKRAIMPSMLKHMRLRRISGPSRYTPID